MLRERPSIIVSGLPRVIKKQRSPDKMDAAVSAEELMGQPLASIAKGKIEDKKELWIKPLKGLSVREQKYFDVTVFC